MNSRLLFLAELCPQTEIRTRSNPMLAWMLSDLATTEVESQSYSMSTNF